MNWLDKVKDFFSSIPRFLGEVKAEMKKVSFPSRDEVVGTTIVVLVTSVVFAVYLWVADMVIVQLFKMAGTS
ncbi:MAG: preprotein translocase subunit SecE [Thermoanaerobaculia bacterium]